ncbi:LysR family transcriptional regulator [Dyella flava]|uniref:LysR family transcriptional regulator n=1 Tax=Dyella flava TaxID=1920170 RepID=A0ABS2JZZ8_9GAMM|nr:LysR family transcriptional regulator [Dyella flava]MBM7124434.1 LysR family transcriptional regulator [Dyella flava]GLQ51905.1 LysR family transcriptional regulator [Dyella flava]
MAPHTDLRHIDLNLLLVFDALYRDRSTTRAAESLHLTQPAVSNALKRLRTAFDDVLFVKASDGMQPTPRADEIAAFIDEGFASLHLALQAGRAFDPGTSTRTFRLYVSDLGQAIFVPPLMAHLRRIAPGIRIVTIDPPLDTAQQLMKIGQIDLAIGLFTGLHADFHQQLLFRETYVALVRKDHAAVGATMSIDQFFAASHLAYMPTAGSHSHFEAKLNERCPQNRKTRYVALQLAHSFGLDRVVASSDLVACIPSRLARVLASREGVRAVALPFDIAPAEIGQFWHERYQRDEGHHWLRGLVYDLFHDQRPSAVL